MGKRIVLEAAEGGSRGKRGGDSAIGAPWDMVGVDFVCFCYVQGVLASGSLASNESDKDHMRRAVVDADLVDRMIGMPANLFCKTPILAYLLFPEENRIADAKRGFRDHRNENLIIDARNPGTLIERLHRELIDADLENINLATAKFGLN